MEVGKGFGTLLEEESPEVGLPEEESPEEESPEVGLPEEESLEE
jgi:hypothetical protein